LLFFGHAGITLGVSAVIAYVADEKRKESGWFTSLSRHVDIRWLVIGSLLPDIIDKPIGIYLFKDTFDNGRIFSHTLLFLILVSAVGVFLWKRYHRVWMLSLAAGTLMHLVLDESWLAPGTLFWPLLGLNFPRIELNDFLLNLFEALFLVPKTTISELIGLIIVIWFGLVLLRRKTISNFIKYGQVA
jgi:inner membrane protein